MKKKVLALILAMSMLFSMFGTALAANVSDFSDMPNDWSRPALERAIENGLLSGSNGKINASGLLSRAEMASIVVRAFGATEKADLSAYSDVKVSDWFYADMQKAVAMGVITGSNNRLNPTASITREEVCAVLYRAFLLRDGGSAAKRFGDYADIASWAEASVAAMTAGGHVTGDAYGNMNPGKTITRAEFAQMMDSLVKRYPTGSVSGTIDGNVVVKSANVDLTGAVIKGDLILADGLGKADINLSSCTVEGRVIIRGGSEVKLSKDTGAERVIAAIPGGELTLSGETGTVEVRADNMTIVAAKDAEIDTVEVAASGTTIEGEGKVETVEVQAGSSKTEVTTAKTEITVDKNGGKVTSNNGSLSAGETGTTDNAGRLEPETSSKPSSGSSSSSGSSTKKYDVIDANGTEIGTFKKGTTLTIDPANGEDSYTVTVNGDVKLDTPSREGYTFAGWTVSGTTITAKWTENDTPVDPEKKQITVKDTAGTEIGTFEEGTVLTIDPANDEESYTVEVNSAAVITVPAYEGYTFKEWLVSDTVVTAQWTIQEVPTAINRQKFNFNADWQFSKGYGYDNAESNRDTKREVIVLPDTEKPYEEGYVLGDTWENVSLPHTYNDVDTFDNFTENGMNGERSVYAGTAWYKKTFTIPAEYKDKKIFLEFEAARQAAEVYINGAKLEGKSENGFIPFGYDLTEYIRFGEENDITVMVDNSFPYYHIGEDGSKNELSWHDSHWHPNNGGLYRNAFLYVTDPLHVTLPLYSFLETQGTYVYTENETEASADVVMDAEIQNEYDTEKIFTYVAEIEDMDGNVVCTKTSEPLTLQAGEKKVFSLTGELENPEFWSTEYPYLYRVVTRVLVDGVEVDSTETPLGVRVFRFTNDSGMFLNENYLKLEGWGQKPTDEWAGLGAAYPDWMHAYTQELMKDAGGNFIRWGHCAGSPTQIAISDQYGIVTLQPGVDGEGSTVGGVYSELSYEVRKNAFRDMIIYYRNNPSIFLWEIGNQSMPDAEAKALTNIIYQYDGHGMEPDEKNNSGSYDETEAASNRLIAVRRGNSVMSKYVDVSVTTLGDWELKSDGKPGVEGEYNREEARRGVWDRYTEGYEGFKTTSGSSYNLTEEQFAANQAKEWNSKLKAVEHSGGANWIFSDSTSHGRVYSEVSRASGEVDAVRLPKEAYYTLKTIYTDEVDVYLIGHWNYDEGTVKDVYAMSDAASVKLVVEDKNGAITEYNGTKSNDYLFTFANVTYTPGSATAIAYDKAGNEVARSTKATHGEAVALRITPIMGSEGLLANGSDILLLDVEAVDAEGNRCLTFDGTVNNLVTNFEINDDNGCSVWRGGYNGGIEHSTNNKYLYLQGGINRVAIRTTMKAGDITVTATTEGLSSATITVTSKAIDNTGGLNAEMNQFKKLSLGNDPGMGDGEKPPARDDGTVTEQKSALMKEAFYTGSDGKWSVTFPAVAGEQVYSDEKNIEFGDLPIELLNSEYLQIPQADANLTGATDVIALRFARDVNLYIAHDDQIEPRPDWITEGYTDTGMDIEIDGHTHSVFTRAFAADASITLEANVTDDVVTGGNQYVVFVKEQGQEKTFLMDDFDSQTAGESPVGWVVNSAENTSAKIADIDGNMVLELWDENTGSAPNMAIVSRKFQPQSGKFALEYKIYDYNLSVNNKKQDFVRLFLLKDAPSSDPNVHTGTVVESYIRSDSVLKARQANGSGTKDVTIKALEREKWFTVRYIVDMVKHSYDAYVLNEATGEFELAKANIGFRNDHDYVNYLVLGSGGSSGTHVLIDDVKIELLDNALDEITVDGESLDAFDPDTFEYTYTLPVGTEESYVPVVKATARDPYATVVVDQAENANGTATITVTALNGDKQTYTVQFTVAAEYNDTVKAILLNGAAFKGFDPEQTEYEIILAPEEDWPEITVTPESPSDTIQITGNETEEVTISVNGIGEYTITFEKAAYELNEDFSGSELPEGWTSFSTATTPDAGTAVTVEDGALKLTDNDSGMLIVCGALQHEYTTADLKGKKIVFEFEEYRDNSLLWIRHLLCTGDSFDGDGKSLMAAEVYTSTNTNRKGNVVARNDSQADQTFFDTGSVKADEWTKLRIEVIPDRDTITVTLGDQTVSKSGSNNLIRKNDEEQTKITHVQFGTGASAKGQVSFRNVQVYVCTDID